MLTKMDRQRSLSVAHVNTLASDMANGKWGEDVAAIAFDRDGNLVNGQHRLNAIVKSNMPQWFWIRRGLPDDAILRIDQGRGRRAADQLKIQGVANATSVAAIASIMWCVDNQPEVLWHSRHLSKSQLTDYGLQHDDELQEGYAWQDRLKITGRIATAPYAALAILVQRHSDHAEGFAEFHQGLSKGVNLSEGDPRLTLRNHIAMATDKNMRNPHWGGRQSSTLLLIRVWNYWAVGDSLKVIKIPKQTVLKQGPSIYEPV